MKRHMHWVRALKASWHLQNNLTSQPHGREWTAQQSQESADLLQVAGIHALHPDTPPATGQLAVTQGFQLSLQLGFLPIEGPHEPLQAIHSDSP